MATEKKVKLKDGDTILYPQTDASLVQNLKTINNTTLVGPGDIKVGTTHFVSNIEVNTSGWNSSNNLYYKEVEVSGITADDNPDLDLFIQDNTTPTNIRAQAEAYSKLVKGTTLDGKINLYATEIPGVTFYVMLKW